MPTHDADSRLILASASPRRRELLAAAGYAFEVRPADIDETLPAESAAAGEVARRLALEKARAVAAAEPAEGRWVIGADTIVVLGRRIIGKPRDAADAVAILRDLSGSRHAVITGLALVQTGSLRSYVREAVTWIRMRPIPEDEIRSYVTSGGSHGTAGAYAIQEGGDRFVESTEGSFSNIVGLPMELLAEMLGEVGYCPKR